MILKLKKIIGAIILLILSNSLLLKSSGFLFQHITINQGLSQSSVRSILQDKFGYLWFATQDGLNRYDGYEFKIFRHTPGDSSSLTNNFIYALDQDTKGNIWAATQNGFSKFDLGSETFDNYYYKGKENSTSDNVIYSIKCSDLTGNIYLGTLEGLVEFNPVTKSFKKYDKPADSSESINCYLNTIYESNAGVLWMGFSSGGFYKFDKTTLKYTKIFLKPKFDQKELKFKSITSIIDTKDGNLWIGTFTGLYRYNIKEQKAVYVDLYIPGFPEYKTNLNISAIEMDNSGKLWIGTTGGGVYIYDRKKQHSTLILNETNNPYSPSSNTILAIKKDKTGIIWLGTYGNGIDKFNPDFNRFGLTNIFTGLPLRSVRTFYEDKDGMLWIGGYGKGLVRYDIAKDTYSTFSPQQNSFTTNNIYKIIPDRTDPDNILWLGTDGGGLVKFNKKNGLFKKYPFALGKPQNELSGSHVHTMVFDDSNHLWIGTEAGLNKLDTKTNNFTHYFYSPDDSASITPGTVAVLYIDSRNNFWVGSSMGGIAKFDRETGKFRRFQHFDKDAKSVSSNNIKCILEDSKHRLWVGTNGGGISMLDAEKGEFINFTQKDGLPNDVVYGILEDTTGYLWLSTNYGITRFNPDAVTFKNYSVSDGLQSNEFNSSAYYKSDAGKFYFGGIEGYNSFFPDSIVINHQTTEVAITNFYIFNDPVDQNTPYKGRKIFSTSFDLTKEIQLNYNLNMITLKISALDYHSSIKNRYAYKLEGFDKDWIYLGTNRFLTYTNLDPGIYHLKIKATNSDGVWSNTSRVLTITISPPFWDTLIFKISAVVFVILLVLFIIKLRLKAERARSRKLEKLVKERTEELEWLNDELKKSENNLLELNATKDKFFSIVAHDLKNPLAAITGFSDLIVNNYESFTHEEFIEISNDIYRTSKQLHNLLDNLLTWSRSQSGAITYSPQKFDIYTEIDMVIQIMAAPIQVKDLTVISDVQKNSYVYADENMVNTIIRNLISNAVKFTPEGGQIYIRCNFEDGFATISVEDTGIGISEEDIKKLFRIDVQHTSIGTSNEPGTGLGLVLSKEFVEKNNGKIWVESKLSVGSKFIFTLPIGTTSTPHDMTI